MTGPEHYEKAERYLGQAERWMNADTGWMAHLSTEERLARRMADLAAAQAHATLAAAAATALGSAKNGMPSEDFGAWDKVAGVPVSPGDSLAR